MEGVEDSRKPVVGWICLGHLLKRYEYEKTLEGEINPMKTLIFFGARHAREIPHG